MITIFKAIIMTKKVKNHTYNILFNKYNYIKKDFDYSFHSIFN